MSISSLAPRHALRIKAATRDLVAACGGVAAAGTLCGVAPASVSRWQAIEDAALIPIGAVLALEAECGAPLVTAVMAEINGRRLADDEAGDGRPGKALGAAAADLARQAGAAMAEATEALADGVVSPAEAAQIDRRLSGMDAASRRLRDCLAGIQAGGSRRR
jgi:hypothetical protein